MLIPLLIVSCLVDSLLVLLFDCLLPFGFYYLFDWSSLSVGSYVWLFNLVWFDSSLIGCLFVCLIDYLSSWFFYCFSLLIVSPS
jgi:hypothetical protein